MHQKTVSAARQQLVGAAGIVGISILRSRLCRPKGRCHIMVPAGGANAEGWLAFRDVLARIEAYTTRSTPAQVLTTAQMLLQ